MLYFDTSFLVPLFLEERTSNQVEHFLKGQSKDELAISHWTRLEFSSFLVRDVRMGDLDRNSALEIDAEFDAIVDQTFTTVAPAIEDFELARAFVRRYETRLRSGDALHLAIASNRKMRAIYSFDRGLLRAGQILGLPVMSQMRRR